MKQFWDLPWWQRFVFAAGERSEWKLVNWRIAVVVYSLMSLVMVGASFYFWPAAPVAAVFVFLAWVSWHYGRHMKGAIDG